MVNNSNVPTVENAFAGIVITAQTFNPSIFTETWLTRNEIVAADALVGSRIFSAQVAQFQTTSMQVLVIPLKMQVTFGIYGNNVDPELPQKLARRTVELLPHTPYQALGLNFDFFVRQPNEQYNRALLGSGSCRLLQEFSTPDSRFGRYFSKNHGDGRLKLDIKPVQAGPENKELLQFSFNFHHEVSCLDPDARAPKLVELVGSWASLRQYSERLVNIGSTIEVNS